MSLSNQVSSLSARLQSAADEAKERAQAAADVRGKIAADFDAHTAGACPLPEFVHVSNLYGTVGSLDWKDQTPADVLKLAETFPPLPAGLHKSRRGTSYKLDSAASDEPETFTAGDGVALRLSGGLSYGQAARIEWNAALAGGSVVRICAHLRAVHGILPFLYVYDGVRDNDGRYKRILADRVRWGIRAPGVSEHDEKAGLCETRYSRGSDTAFSDRLYWQQRGKSPGVLDTVRAWDAECFARGVASRAAYERDKAAGGLEPRERREREPYASRKLRAGTAAQSACLESEAAIRDEALASKHWKEYAADHGIKAELSDAHFNYYTWACSWLERNGLLHDPSLLTKDGKGYRYGSAWL